jgi:CrcB protein
MKSAAIVFLGGGIGACARAALLEWLAPTGSPWAVLLVNLIGSFVIGVIFVLADEAGMLRPRIRQFVAVGILGGFTTFSTFGWGADVLLANHAGFTASAYLLASVAGGILMVFAGLAAGRELAAMLMPVRVPPFGHGNARRTPRHSAPTVVDEIDREMPA